MKKVFISLFLFMSTMAIHAQQADFNVVPLPQQVKLTAKPSFKLSNATRIAYPEGSEEMERNAHFLQDYVQEITGIRPVLSTNLSQSGSNVIRLVLDGKMSGDESYTLSCNQKGVTIKGRTPAGVFYGIQTLRKSLPVVKTAEVTLPAVEIADAPRFSYRGVMLDCGRHYFPVKFIKEFIDLLAMHNMNRFHWHLTEDQGWRLEIKKYPLLTAIGSKRAETVIGHNTQIGDGTPYEGYYTQDEARDIVEYARQRHIVVVPEIDMPGHQLAALAAMPNLGCTGGPYKVGTVWGVYDDILCLGNEDTYKFCEDVLSELIDIFPSEVIHIGGDEAPTVRVEHCPKCQALMQREHLTPKNIQGYFTNRIEKFVNSKGRRIMGWDEIMDGDINTSAMVHCWRNPSFGIKAAQKGHDVVLSPTKYCYFDFYQANPRAVHEPLAIGGYLPVDSVYNMDTMPKDISPENRKHIIGIQANLWTEYVAVPNHAEYMLLPRMAALAENAWVKDRGLYSAFLPRLTRLKSLYDVYNLHYANHVWKK